MIKRSDSVILVGWAGIVLFPNHDLFNYVFAGTPLAVWKQLIALTLWFFAVDWLRRGRAINRADIIKKKIILAYLLMGLVYVVYSILIGISITRVAYGIFFYAGLPGYLYFSSIIDEREARFKLYKVIALLSFLGSLGLIVDYYTSVFMFLPRLDDVDSYYFERHDVSKRAAFLFGASTTVFQFQSFGILAMAFVSARRGSLIAFIKFNVFSLFALFSIYLTGSRAGFFLFIFAYLVAYWVVARNTAIVGRFLVISACVTFLLVSDTWLSDFGVISVQSERFSAVLSAADAGNSHRFFRWSQGFSLMARITPEWVLGNGIGTTISRLGDDIETSTHFESSVIQAFYEGGFGLIVYRYLAAIVALSVYFRHLGTRCAETTGLAMFLFLHFISTAVAPTFGTFHTQLVFFVASGLLISISCRLSRSKADG